MQDQQWLTVPHWTLFKHVWKKKRNKTKQSTDIRQKCRNTRKSHNPRRERLQGKINCATSEAKKLTRGLLNNRCVMPHYTNLPSATKSLPSFWSVLHYITTQAPKQCSRVMSPIHFYFNSLLCAYWFARAAQRQIICLHTYTQRLDLSMGAVIFLFSVLTQASASAR